MLIISAKKTYQEISSNTMDWKKLSFKDVLTNNYHVNKYHNILSIGDAEYEYYALVNLYHWNHHLCNKKKFLKSVKLIRSPNFNQIHDELNVLYKTIDTIVDKKENMDLNFVNN